MQQQILKTSATDLPATQFTPNLIMPGVAKCGTTTLYDILVQHPDITGGVEKELRFLLDKDDDIYQPKNIHNDRLAGWMASYPDGGRGPFRYWIDASPQYQWQTTAYQTIAGLPEKPRLIFIVRRPSKRLFTMYRYARYQMGALPHVTSFAQFIEELRSPASSPIAPQRMLANALADSRYDEMLERWSAIVPPGHVWVTSVEALGSDRKDVLADLAQWLGVDAGPFLDLPPIRSNPTIRVRHHKLLAAGGRIARHLPNTGLFRKAKNWARNFLVAPVLPDEIEENATLLAELDREFTPHVERFNALAARMQPGYRPLPI
ncbi:MAG: hypothetical protein AB7F98_07965 [Novosphingobium sp.]